LPSTGLAVRRAGKGGFAIIANPISTTGATIVGTIGAILAIFANAISTAGTTIALTGGAIFPIVTNPISATGGIARKHILTLVVHTEILGAQIIAIVTIRICHTAIENNFTRHTTPCIAYIVESTWIAIITTSHNGELLTRTGGVTVSTGALIAIVTLVIRIAAAARPGGEEGAFVVDTDILCTQFIPIITIRSPVTTSLDKRTRDTLSIETHIPFSTWIHLFTETRIV